MRVCEKKTVLICDDRQLYCVTMSAQATNHSSGTEHTASMAMVVAISSMAVLVVMKRRAAGYSSGVRPRSALRLAVCVVVSGCALLEPLHLPALFLVLRHVLVSFAVSGVPRRYRAFFLLARLAQEGAQAFDLELQFRTIVMRLSDSFHSFFVLVPPVI